MDNSRFQELRKRANNFVEELEAEFGAACQVAINTESSHNVVEMEIAVAFMEQGTSDNEKQEDPQFELDFNPEEVTEESPGEDDVEQLHTAVTSEPEASAPKGDLEQVDEKEPEPASKPKKRSPRKTRPSKEELLDKMRDYVTSGGDRAGLKAYTKVTLGAANTDALKVGDYAKVIAWIDGNPASDDAEAE